MATIRLTKVFNFAMAHALHNYDGLCKNIHGHSYHFEVTVVGRPNEDKSSPKKGMLIDFSVLKKLINRELIDHLDHSLMLSQESDPALIQLLQKNYEKIVLVPFQPTTENMLSYFAEKIKAVLPPDVQLFSLKLKETDNSFAEWFASDNQ